MKRIACLGWGASREGVQEVLDGGTEGVVALGLANVILANKLRPADGAGRAGAVIDGWSGGLVDYAPAKVEQITGVPAKKIELVGCTSTSTSLASNCSDLLRTKWGQ